MVSLKKDSKGTIEVDMGNSKAYVDIECDLIGEISVTLRGREGLSEYFLYTIEGTETIPHGWSKRLPSFEANEVPVVNLYKYEEERYGSNVVMYSTVKSKDSRYKGKTEGWERVQERRMSL